MYPKSSSGLVTCLYDFTFFEYLICALSSKHITSLNLQSSPMRFAVQSLSRVQLFATPWTAARQDSLSLTISWSLLKLMSIESMMPSNHLIRCHTFTSCPQSFLASESFPELALRTRWPQYQGFSFSISLMRLALSNF